MTNLKDMIEKYDISNNDYKAILYVHLTPGNGKRVQSEQLSSVRQCEDNISPIYRGRYPAKANQFAILTVHDEYLCFYIFKYSENTIDYKKIIPYDCMVNLNIRKCLFGNELKFLYYSDNKRWKMNISFYDKVLLVKGQEEHAKILKETIKMKIGN